ncbi:E3 SUMO-protein ligase ZBED1-like [Ruditapes philippinarum]|uniref:E3 SUMO-protein ligase ZBED1-like n=1 Tax=Ruditapes philippinarum TaxID=129788 RepID=UPI00295B2660|nr:E3 SUMO-protein ligase ZBED1-like [Ruditapes philippinarum]
MSSAVTTSAGSQQPTVMELFNKRQQYKPNSERSRIRRVVSYFHRSTTAAAILRDKIKLLGLRQVKLIQDVCTRWNSAVDMVERFLELQPAIYTALMSKDIRAKEVDIATLSEVDIGLAENIMSVLIPIRTVSTALCSESMPTASLILPLQKKLIKGLSVKDDDMQSHLTTENCTLIFYHTLNAQHYLIQGSRHPASQRKMLFPITNRVISEAASTQKVLVKQESDTSPISDMETTGAQSEPALPQLELEGGVETSSQKVEPQQSGLALLLEDVIIVKTVQGTKTKMDQAREQMDAYLQMETLSLGANPLVWWKDNEWKLPLLASLARKYLCVPATSVPSERVFSTAGDILSAQRASLDADKVDMLNFS